MSTRAAEEEYKIVFVKVVGGEAPGSALAAKLGPLGVPAKLVAEDIKKLTTDYRGIRLLVEIKVKDRKATVIPSPSTSALIIKALKEPMRDRKKEKNILHNGSLRMTDVIEIARLKMGISKARSLKNMVKSVLGTCLSVGCNIEGKGPKVVISEINDELIKIPEK